MSNTQPTSDDADLDWLAFRYVTGELDRAQSESFEARLAEDQSAREAVAAAVRLHTLLRAAIEQPTVQPRRSPIAITLQRIALLAASCGAIAYVGSETHKSQPPVETIALRDDLATAWAGLVDVNEVAAREPDMNPTELASTAETSTAETSAAETSAAETSAAETSTAELSAAETAETESLAPPLWMLAALDTTSTEAAAGDDELEVEAPSDISIPPAAVNEESPDDASPEARRVRNRPEGSGASVAPQSNWMYA